jgi:6-phosphogluconolactonase
MDQIFETREAASAAAAQRITAALRRRLDVQSSASLVVSGGTTPALCFANLSKQDIDWQRVGILASDDRWVPADHEDSNEKLIRCSSRRPQRPTSCRITRQTCPSMLAAKN